jgi:hypothetical protein
MSPGFKVVWCEERKGKREFHVEVSGFVAMALIAALAGGLALPTETKDRAVAALDWVVPPATAKAR